MDSDGISLVIVLCVLIIMSAYFSATETAFTNFNKTRIKNLAGAGNKRAMQISLLSDDNDKLLSTILIGNNIVNIIAASLATIIFTKYFERNGVIISTVVMVVVILIFGEIFPKSIARKSPDEFAMFSMPILKVIMFILSPFNCFSIFLKKLLDKLLKVNDHPSITEDELKIIIDEVENEGVINKHESDLIRSAIEFNDVDVEDIFTPRIDIVGVSENDSIEEIKKVFLLNGYSRLPVFHDNMDHIVGIIHEKDFYQAINRCETDISKIVKDALYVTPNKKISELLRDLQQSKAHIAIVIDEYGGTAGLITLEDIIEELVGEIWDEHDEVVEHFKKIDNNNYIVSCNADLDDMFDLFDLEVDEDLDSSTVNGWIMQIFECIPDVGDKIVYKNLNITVTKAESNRVLEISVEKTSGQNEVLA